MWPWGQHPTRRCKSDRKQALLILGFRLGEDEVPAYILFMLLLIFKDFSVCYIPYQRSQSGNLGAEHSPCKYSVCQHNGFFYKLSYQFLWTGVDSLVPPPPHQFWPILAQPDRYLSYITSLAPKHFVFANPVLYIQRQKWQNNSSPQKLYPLLYIRVNPRNWGC